LRGAVKARHIAATGYVDAHGEREAAAIAARIGPDGPGAGRCGKETRIYDATPGWFLW
jgi:hypothetical protein